MMERAIDLTHEKFKKHLKESQAAVSVVAGWLQNRMNKMVTLTPNQVAEKRKDWAQNSDMGDLYVQERVEVKHLSKDYPFTCREDWAFGDRYIICSKGSYDRAFPKPYMYITLNYEMTHAGILMVPSTKASWFVEAIPDRHYPGEPPQEKYLVNTDKVVFLKLWPEGAQQK